MNVFGHANLHRLLSVLFHHQLLDFTQANKVFHPHHHHHRDRSQDHQLDGRENLSPYSTNEPYDSTSTSNSLAMSFILGNATNSYHPINIDDFTYPGRVGFISIYLPSFILSTSDTGPAILYIGGQIDSAGTYITNDVMMFRPTKPYQSPSSSDPNPQLLPFLSNGLPPISWASGEIDHQGQLWVMGGVVEDCHHTALAYLRDLKDGSLANWTSWHPHRTNSTVKRRRQTRAVRVIRPSNTHHTQHSSLTFDSRFQKSSLISNQSISNSHEHADFWILGGVSDPYTCSKTLLPHLGVDKWDTQTSTVHSLKLDCLHDHHSTCLRPPIADYSVTTLSDEARKIIYIGGQMIDGSFGRMENLFVLDTLHEKLEYMSAIGVIPSPRRAHASILIPSFGVTLVHGGLSPHQNITSDSHLLNTTSIPWKWTELKLTNQSLSPPNRAFHSMHLIFPNLILISFGIQSETELVEGEEAFFILRLDHDPNSYELLGTWSTTHDPRIYLPLHSNSQPIPTNSQSIPTTLPSIPSDEGTSMGDESKSFDPSFTQVNETRSDRNIHSHPLPAPPAIQTTTVHGSDHTLSKGVSQHQKAIVGAVSAVCGSFILGLCALFFMRSRQRGKPTFKSESIHPFNHHELDPSETLNSTHNLDFITPMSSVQVTRPCAIRVMTLGSSSIGFDERDGHPLNPTSPSFRSDHQSRLSSFSIQDESSQRSFRPISSHNSIRSPNASPHRQPSGLHRRRNSRLTKSMIISEVPSSQVNTRNESRPPSQTSIPSNVYIAHQNISSNLRRSTPEFDPSLNELQSSSNSALQSTFTSSSNSQFLNRSTRSIHSQTSVRSYPYLMPIPISIESEMMIFLDHPSDSKSIKESKPNESFGNRFSPTIDSEIPKDSIKREFEMSDCELNEGIPTKSVILSKPLKSDLILSTSSSSSSSSLSNLNWLEKIKPKFDSMILSTSSIIKRSIINEVEKKEDQKRKESQEKVEKEEKEEEGFEKTHYKGLEEKLLKGKNENENENEDLDENLDQSIGSQRLLRITNASMHSSPGL